MDNENGDLKIEYIMNDNNNIIITPIKKYIKVYTISIISPIINIVSQNSLFFNHISL
jgi:hypothetical protein